MGLFVSGLFVYPIKSCRGNAVSAAALDAQGLRHDRRWMVVRAEDGVFLTQREYPQMAQIDAQVLPRSESVEDALFVCAPQLPVLKISVADSAFAEAAQERRAVTVWRFNGAAIDEGDVAAEWFSDLFKMPCRLVRTPRDFTRRVNPENGRENDRVGFADGYPLLLTSVASLDDLNRRLVAQNKPPVSMERFRPNLVVAQDTQAGANGALETLAPFDEDHWETLDIGRENAGGVTFRVASPCARCSVTTVDQAAGKAYGPEPLQTLAKFRRGANGKVMFGMNLIHDVPPDAPAPLVHVGDTVHVTRRAA